MEAVRTRFEVRVGTLVCKAALATFRVPVRPTAVLRNTVYRFRVPVDGDLTDVLQLLTERDVQVLEIRRCPEPRLPQPRTPGPQAEEPVEGVVESAAPAGAVVVPFPGGAARRPRTGLPDDRT